MKRIEINTQSTVLEKVGFGVILIAFLANIFYPNIVYAEDISSLSTIPTELASLTGTDILAKRFAEAEKKYVSVTKNVSEKKVEEITSEGKVMRVSSTAYSSDVAQTDATPCITADGFNVCANGQENVVAANFLPFGTKIKIPELFGDRVFTVHDRMNKRYYYKVDIWMTSRDRAIQYGVRNIKIVILDK
ncbi:hypothetical protein A2533_02645 [Candidatus Falkowbacteria bacterium RIFOXYD2_FULL_35_9]|nr:MAG: hypothetical protein A2533_02645 [Candidatus Falkowbacteria bacterium RIFOXYD2_FULL_35_9]